MKKFLGLYYITKKLRSFYPEDLGLPEIVNMEQKYTRGVVNTTFEKVFWRFYRMDNQTIKRF